MVSTPFICSSLNKSRFFSFSRYLLQLMMEANCLEIASLISVILKDALALIRIVNAVRSPPEDKTAVSRIYQNLKALEAWAQSEW